MVSNAGGQGSKGLGWREIACYAAPAAAFALPTVPATVHLPALHVDSLGIAATGLALFVARFGDVILDPLIGWIGDRYGHRKLLVLLGAVACGAACWRLFIDPTHLGFAGFLAWSVLLFAGWTAITIHYAAWGNDLAPSYHLRTRLNGAREGVALLGIFAAVAVPALLVSVGGENRSAIATVVGSALVAGAAALLLALIVLPEARHIRHQHGHGLRELWGNGPFRRLLLVWTVNGVANGLPASLFMIYVTRGLGGREADAALCLLIYFGAGLVGMPLWLHLSRRIGRHKSWAAAMVLAAIVFAAVPLLPHGQVFAFMVVCLLSGLALGADLAIPPALQGDVSDFERLRSGRNQTGLLFALCAMAQKLAQALAIGLGFGLLALAGFDDASPSERSTALLPMIYSAIPVVFKLSAAAVIWGFPITPARQEAVRRRLMRKDTI